MTWALLAMCAVAFGLELAAMTAGGEDALNALIDRWGLVPADLVAALSAGRLISQPTLTVVTHMFLHGSWFHLMGNLLFLWIFAVNVEDRLGRVLFPAFYLAGGIVAAAGQVLSDPSSDVAMIGASGAIAAVLGGYLVLFPRARIQSLVFPIFYYELMEVPAVLVLGFWFLLQLIDGVASIGLTPEAAGGIAIWAHVGGFVAGMAMALPLRSLRPAAIAGTAGAAVVEPPPQAPADGATGAGPPPPPPPPRAVG